MTIVVSVALLAAILLGDARQSVVDVFMAGAAIAGYFALWKTGGFRVLPKAAVLLWAGVLVVGFPLFWQDAMGVAIQNYIRHLFGFMVFGLMYAIRTHYIDEVLESTLFVVGAFVSFFASMFVFVARPDWLPPMNLLYPSYGHNHAADVLLFVFPILMFHKTLPRSLSIFLWFVILSGFIFSFARGAWLLVAVYAAGVCVTHIGHARKTGAVVAGAFFVLLLVVGGVSTGLRAHKTPENAPVPVAIQRLINKGSVFSDPRLEYWRQATRMLRERPLFGSGPGSFYFGSRRLQSRPSAFSWFAHSFPLQTLAEQGVLGALPVFILFGWVAWCMIRFVIVHPPGQSALSRLALGALLTLAYSFIEFNLSFAVVWAMFWAIAGMVLGAENAERQRAKNGVQLLFPTIVLCGFYFLFIGQSVMFSFFPKHENMAFYLTPFDAATAQYYLSSDTVTPHGIRTSVVFHKTDTETLQVVAKAWQRLGNLDLALDTRRKIMWLDPLIEDNHRAYLELLVQLGRYEEAAGWFVRYPYLFFPPNIDRKLVNFLIPPAFLKEYTQELPKLFDPKHSHEVRYSRFYYLLGLWVLPEEPEKTRKLWRFASLLQPKLSHLLLERASLEEHIYNNHSAAMAILNECLNVPAASKNCREVSSLPQLPRPGSFQKAINEK